MNDQLDTTDDEVFAADPLYGQVIDHYPSDRFRLIVIGGAVYAALSLLLNAAFANVDNTTASVFVIGGMSVLALIIGWLILHQWNREVILYERGFSYREGSRTVYFLYEEIRSIRLKAAQVLYFGGVFRRTAYRFTLKTVRHEIITLTGLYRRIDALGLRLEKQINNALRPIIESQLQAGHTVAFGEQLSLSADGVTIGDQFVSWQAYTGYTIADHKLTIDRFQVDLDALENPVLLLALLQTRKRP